MLRFGGIELLATTHDVNFQLLYNVLNNTSKEPLKEGVGAQKKQARIITEEEEELWQKKVMSVATPKGLLNADFFYCGLLFCLRDGSEHRDLKLSQFEIKDVQDPTDGTRMTQYVIYTEFRSKNQQGIVHEVHLDNKVVTHYADKSLGDRCFVSFFQKYVSKLHHSAKENDLFYCKTRSQKMRWNLGFVILLLGTISYLRSLLK